MKISVLPAALKNLFLGLFLALGNQFKMSEDTWVIADK